jgi:hypothetical protein
MQGWRIGDVSTMLTIAVAECIHAACMWGAPNFMTFEEAVVATDRGVIVAINVLESVTHGVVSDSAVREFIQVWAQVYDVLLVRNVAQPDLALIDAIDIIADPDALQRAFGIAGTADFRFLRVVSPTADAVSTVKLAAFVEKICDDASADRFALEGISFPYNATTAAAASQARALESLTDDEREFTIGALGFGDRTLWVTPRAHLASAIGGLAPDDTADRARDVLGLVHRAPGDVMVSIELPAAAAASCRTGRPTFLDGVNPRFTAVARDAPPLSDEWGWTFDLRALFGTGRHAGLPERICDPEPAAAFQGLTTSFAALGVPALPRNDPFGTYDAEFASFLSHGRTPSDLMAALAALR